MNHKPNTVLCRQCWKRVRSDHGSLLPHKDKTGNLCPGSGAMV